MNQEITLKGVRLSYANNLFTPKKNDAGKDTWSSSFILDKKQHADAIKQVQVAIKALAASHTWSGGKVPNPLTICLRDGSLKADKDGYGDHVMFIAANTPKRPVVVDKDLTPLDGSGTRIYSGCYVNAHLRLWAQDNKFGKKVNAELKAVQFVKDGEPFGNDKPVDAAQVFGAVDDEDDGASLMGD